MRSRNSSTHATLLLVLAIGWIGILPNIQGATGLEAIPFQHVDIGLCEDYPKSTRSPEAARRDLELLRAHDIHVLRIAFPWDEIETSPGNYDWGFWDDFVRMATDEFGIRLIPYVCYTPQWNSTGTPTNFWRYPPKDNARFAGFVKTIVGRYRDQINSWEIWNEPDNPEYWEGSTKQFAELFKTGSEAVRQANPRARVVLGGIAWNLEFLRALFESQGVSSYADVVNLHCYYETWSSDSMEAVGEHVLKASNIIAQYGNHQPIWLAEIGYSDYRQGSYISAAYRRAFGYEHTPEFQAQTLGRALTSVIASGNVQLIAWYRIHDLPATTQVIGDENNRRLGVLDEHGRPKPVLQALVFFRALFAGDFHCLDSMTQQLRTIRSDSETHVFERRDGEEFIISWLRIVTLRPVPKNGVDSRCENIEVFLNNPHCRKMLVYSELGHLESKVRLRKQRTGEGWALPVQLRGDEFRVYDCRR